MRPPIRCAPVPKAALGRAGDVEALAQLHLRHQHEHHHRGKTIAPCSGSIGRAPEPAQLRVLATQRSAGPVHHQERRAAWPRHKPEQPEPMLREGARADPPAVGSLPRRVLGRDRKKASSFAPDQRAFVERADDLRRLGIDQARGVELLVRVVPVPPAVGEPLAEPGARNRAADSVLRRRPASRVPVAMARSMSRSSARKSACREWATVEANFMRGLPVVRA